MVRYRHEGGDSSVTEIELTRLSEPQGIQAKECSDKILHIIVCQAEDTTVDTIGVNLQRNQVPEPHDGN